MSTSGDAKMVEQGAESCERGRSGGEESKLADEAAERGAGRREEEECGIRGEGETSTPRLAEAQARDETLVTAIRVAVRTAIYVVYDGVRGSGKDGARVCKALLELVLDEAAAPAPRREMTMSRAIVEYLAPPAASSVAWCAMRYGRKRRGGALSAALLFAMLHRAARHALIHRLFLRVRSRAYSLASLVAIVCCFFRDDLLRDNYLLRPMCWGRYLAPVQGASALARTALHAMAFALPLPSVASSCRRRAAKRVVFAILLAAARVIHAAFNRVAAATSE